MSFAVRFFIMPAVFAAIMFSGTSSAGTVVEVPDTVNHVICSGSGCLRLLTYLQAQDMIVAVDDRETSRRTFEARPYALTNQQFKTKPVFGEFRGRDNPELILMLEPQPEVIFKTYGSSMGYDPGKLQQKTGIPVIALDYGNLGALRPQLFQTLRTMGKVLGKERRAEEVIAYLEHLIEDLKQRTRDISADERPTVFVGGVAFKGARGFQSTEPAYPPFTFINALNLAYDKGLSGKELSHSDIAKEKIIEWDPDFLFVDLFTLQLGDKAGGLFELRHDPAYRTLTAVRKGNVFGLLPYNSYSKNYGSILANAYYIGKVLYPDRFSDIDPAATADEIYSFLVGQPVFQNMKNNFQGIVYERLEVN